MIAHKYSLRSEDHIFAQLYKYSKNKTQKHKDIISYIDNLGIPVIDKKDWK